MLHKFTITTCAFILCLFGLTLMTLTPVFAEDSQEFKSCQQMKWKGNKKAKKNCFRDLARALNANGAKNAYNQPTKQGSAEETAAIYCKGSVDIKKEKSALYNDTHLYLCEEAYINGWNGYQPY